MKKRPLGFAFLAILVFAAFSRCAAAPQTPVTQDLVDQSTVIFKGRVVQTAASNLKILPASSQTVLVRVDEVISAAKTMTNLKGATVTVQLKEPGNLKEGTSATFFTTGWLYGENVALKEVSHITADLSTESLQKQVAELKSRSSDQKLQLRMEHSAMIFLGKVLSARPLEAEGRTRSNSEHDPDWWTADVEVQSLFRGAPSAANRVTLLFAHSNDVMWFRSPKLKEGQQGIWIASEYKPGGFFPEVRVPILAVISPLDYQPSSERDRIQRLMKAPQ